MNVGFCRDSRRDLVKGASMGLGILSHVDPSRLPEVWAVLVPNSKLHFIAILSLSGGPCCKHLEPASTRIRVMPAGQAASALSQMEKKALFATCRVCRPP